MSRPSKQMLLAIAALLALTVFTHWPALHNGFIWDDDDHLTANPAMTLPGGLHKVWTSVTFSRYYPLTLTTFWAERRLWGLNPLPYHAVNIIIHAGNVALIFLLLRRLNIRGAWVAAALWGIHPVNVESVAWITELKNTQSGFFFFASLLCFLQFDHNKSRTWYAFALAAFAAALLSKPSAVVLPFVLLLLAWWQQGELHKADFFRAAPFFALSAGMSLLTIVEQRGQIERSTQDWSLSLAGRLIVAGKALWFYAAKLLWPVDLSFVYSRWEINASSLVSFVPLLGVVGIAGLLWRYQRQLWAQAATFGIGYFAIALLPVLGFLDIYFFRYSFVSDHFQYLASLGILTLVAAAGATLLASRIVQWTLAVVLIAGLGTISRHHAQVFHDDQTLWQDTVAKNPDAFVAWCNLGVIDNGKKLYVESERYFRQALRLKPGFLEAQSNLGLALTEQQRYEEAEQALQEALRIKPDYSKALYCLGHLFYKIKKPAESEQYFHRAILAEPTMAEAYYDLGTLLLEQGRTDEATKCYRLALSLQPDYALVNSNLARILVEKGELDEAIRLYERAVRADPKLPELRYNLAVTYRTAGRLDDSINQFRAAIELYPGLGQAYFELGKTFVQARRYSEAIDTFRRGLEIEPSHMIMGNEMAWLMATVPDASLRNAPQAIQIGEQLAKLTARKEPKPLVTLAAAYAEAGRFDEAVTTAHEALALAGAQNQSNLVTAISIQLKNYEAREPYRTP
ncbi:MAG TPA: tetratricopeptide repeat protein [Verrucomicrobiae bacterium]|nr:tetratricopeptide repeat protein [Verrucomicrobiae bacterium]